MKFLKNMISAAMNPTERGGHHMAGSSHFRSPAKKTGRFHMTKKVDESGVYRVPVPILYQPPKCLKQSKCYAPYTKG